MATPMAQKMVLCTGCHANFTFYTTGSECCTLRHIIKEHCTSPSMRDLSRRHSMSVQGKVRQMENQGWDERTSGCGTGERWDEWVSQREEGSDEGAGWSMQLHGGRRGVRTIVTSSPANSTSGFRKYFGTIVMPARPALPSASCPSRRLSSISEEQKTPLIRRLAGQSAPPSLHLTRCASRVLRSAWA